MTDPMEDTNTDFKDPSSDASSVYCSVCLDLVTDDGDRSRAKLQCGHEFHLDCIGSAFNVKGVMQCPNCRKVERGRWLYASGATRSFSDISMDNFTFHEDQYGFAYPDIPYNIHWCPFSGLAQVHSAFEAVESSQPGYHNLHRLHHTMFGEHGAASSLAHSFVAYLRPTPPASSNTSEAIEDPHLSYQWNSLLGDMFNPHAFSVADNFHYQNVHHLHPLPVNSNRANSTDGSPVPPPVTLRSARVDFGAMTRSNSSMHPFRHGHSNRSHERLQPSQTIHHHPHQPSNPLRVASAIMPSMVRFHGQRPLLPFLPANSESDRNGSFFIFPSQGSSVHNSHETENSLPGIPSDRTGNFWHRHWS